MEDGGSIFKNLNLSVGIDSQVVKMVNQGCDNLGPLRILGAAAVLDVALFKRLGELRLNGDPNDVEMVSLNERP